MYVRELSSALARSGADCDVFTRAWSAELPPVIEVEPGLRVHHVPAGPLEPDGQGVAPRGGPRVHRSRARGDDLAERPAAERRGGRAVRGRPRQLLAVRSGRAHHQARARPAAHVHVPHPRPGEGGGRPRRGRGGHAAPPGRGRGGDHRLFRRGPRVVQRRGRPDRRALRGRPGPGPARPAGSRPRVLRPRRPFPSQACVGFARRRPAAALCRPDPAPQGGRRRGAGPRRAQSDPPGSAGHAGRRRRPERAPGPGRLRRADGVGP